MHSLQHPYASRWLSVLPGVPRVSQPFNPSNAPDTCLWCGRKLYRSRGQGHASRIKHAERMGYRLDPNEPEYLYQGRRGWYGSGVFCTGSCAQEFGLAAARLGFRMKKKGTP